MTLSVIRIATRKSALALWQAEHVAAQLRAAYPKLIVTLIGVSTQGDKILDAPLANIGGKGLFVKELEQKILDGTADIAVHSMKDVPVELPAGLQITAILARDDPLDAFVSNQYSCLAELPPNSIVGTSSLRRECQLRAWRSDLQIKTLRGNVNTRLAKLDNNQYAAIILASAGLKRLNFSHRICSQLTLEQSLPAIGQGAIGIESKIDADEINAVIATLADATTTACIRAERAMNQQLHGGCQVPIAGFAVQNNHELYLRGLVGNQNGKHILRAEGKAITQNAELLGLQVANDLLKQGAKRFLTY
jgi:hydroxymethylbilane synthase